MFTTTGISVEVTLLTKKKLAGGRGKEGEEGD